MNVDEHPSIKSHVSKSNFVPNIFEIFPIYKAPLSFEIFPIFSLRAAAVFALVERGARSGRRQIWESGCPASIMAIKYSNRDMMGKIYGKLWEKYMENIMAIKYGKRLEV